MASRVRQPLVQFVKTNSQDAKSLNRKGSSRVLAMTLYLRYVRLYKVAHLPHSFCDAPDAQGGMTMKIKLRELALLALALSFGSMSACALFGQQAKPAGPMGIEDKDDEADSELPVSVEGLTVRRFDVNKDKKPDVIKYFKEVNGDEIMVRKEFDLNFDGKIDVWRFYADTGELLREDMDYDFDGHVDAENYYEAGELVRQEMDLDFDGKPDMKRFYEKGVIARMEADTNKDGKVDYWEYFEKGKLDRIGIDRDGDGRVDDWKNAASDDDNQG